MDLLVQGTIIRELPIEEGVSQKTGNPWSRKSYIIEHEHGQYPRSMVFDVKNARIKDFNLLVGEEVLLHLNVDCREFNGKYFNSVECWKVDRAQSPAAPPPIGNTPPPAAPAQEQVPPIQTQSNDQLPF